jgi:hypothetical protein
MTVCSDGGLELLGAFPCSQFRSGDALSVRASSAMGHGGVWPSVGCGLGAAKLGVRMGIAAGWRSAEVSMSHGRALAMFQRVARVLDWHVIGRVGAGEKLWVMPKRTRKLRRNDTSWRPSKALWQAGDAVGSITAMHEC